MKITLWLKTNQADCWTITEGQIQKMQSLLPNADILNARSREEFERFLPETEVAVTWSFRREWASIAPRLRFIITPAAGLGYFSTDLPGIKVINSGFHGRIISETVVGMMLAQARGISNGIARMKNEPWPRHTVTGGMRRLEGAHVVILGFGKIGTWVARRVKQFGCRVTGVKRHPRVGAAQEDSTNFFTAEDRTAGPKELSELLPTADFLVIALPRSPETDHVLDEKTLSLLPRHASIYNVGRGNAVDEKALVNILRDGRLAAAYLDVFEEEPLPMDSPLRRLEHCYLMPHSSAATPDYLDLFIDEFAQRVANGEINIEEFRKGR